PAGEPRAARCDLRLRRPRARSCRGHARPRRANRARRRVDEGGTRRVIAPDLAQDLLTRALTRGGDLAELYVEERTGLAPTLDHHRVERPQSGREIGASIRVVVGDSSYFGHVDGLAEEDLRRVAESVSQAVSGESRAPQALSAGADPAEAHAIGQRPESIDS